VERSSHGCLKLSNSLLRVQNCSTAKTRFAKVKMCGLLCSGQRGSPLAPQLLAGDEGKAEGDHTENTTGRRGCADLACGNKDPRATKELSLDRRARRWASGWRVERNIFLAAEILLSILSLLCQNVYRNCKMPKPRIPPQPLAGGKQHQICRRERRDLEEGMWN